MHKHESIVALADPAQSEVIELRSMDAFSSAGVDVNVDGGTIRNVPAMTIGPAAGWGFEIDGVLLQQVADQINAQGGVKMRLGHPQRVPDGSGGTMLGDATGTAVGMFSNARVEAGRLRGDVELGDYAENMPGGGNAKKYLAGIAKKHPKNIGLSVVYKPAPYIKRANALPLGRSRAVDGVDFVDKAAANPMGLLSEPTSPQNNPSVASVAPGIVPLSSSKGGGSMDPILLASLVALGLDPKADAKTAWAFLGEVPAAKRDELLVALAEKVKPAAPAPVVKPAEKEPDDKPADPGTVMLAEHQQRATFLTQLGGIFKLPKEWASEQTVALAEKSAAEFHAEARKLALEAATKAFKPVSLSVGEDEAMVSLQAGMEDAILQRVNTPLVTLADDGSVQLSEDSVPVTRKPHARARQFVGLSLLEMGRICLNTIGVKTEGMTRAELASLVFNRAAIARRTGDIALSLGTGDFPGILANVMNKSLRTAYAVTPITWDQWARRDTNPDFKAKTLLQLSETDIVAVAPGQDYPEASLTESKETYTLGKFGRIISFNWETLINDDLNAFGRAPTKMGNACRRGEDLAAYAVLTGNQTMTEDSTALFHANHANLTTGSGSAWYLAVDPNLYDTVVVAFLEGETGPVFMEEDGFASDTRKYKVRHVYVARAVDYRGLYKSQAALAIAGLDTGKQAMRKQKDIGSKDYLDLNPQILIVSSANEITAKQLIGSPVDPTKNNAVPNPFQGSFKIVSTPRLT